MDGGKLKSDSKASFHNFSVVFFFLNKNLDGSLTKTILLKEALNYFTEKVISGFYVFNVSNVWRIIWPVAGVIPCFFLFKKKQTVFFATKNLPFTEMLFDFYRGKTFEHFVAIF